MVQQQFIQGKKTFLLYPHSVIREEMLDTLLMAGFETYALFNEEKARNVLVKYPGSTMFINIDEYLEEKEWESYIRSIQEDPRTKSSRLGIISYNHDQQLMEKYLINLSIPCGYIQLKLGLKESTRIMIKVLQANEAREGPCKFRVSCEQEKSSTFNYQGYWGIYRGKLLELSASGIAVRFEKTGYFYPGTVLQGVQLKLHGKIIITDMTIVGQRRDDEHVYILLFQNLSFDHRFAVFRYMKHCMEKKIEGALSTTTAEVQL
ncbi:MAG: PilZ domain-containing protein [Treponema sp.]|nr:PilZ domain-containing protein [Treponema sp.]